MNNIFDNIYAVLFDLDGTLVDTDIDFSLMKNEMLRLGSKYGVRSSDLERLDILAIIDAISDQLIRQSRDRDADKLRREAFIRLEEIELPACQNARIVDGALELLHLLRNKNIKIGIITRNCRNGVCCSQARTAFFYDLLLTRDDVRNTKPHPDHLLTALQSFDAMPSNALMIGDHWMDIAGGKAAGIRTVGFLRMDRTEDFFDRCPPDFTIRSLAELIDALMRLK